MSTMTFADRGAVGVALMALVTMTLAGGALIVDGGRAMAARRHAANTAEAAAREAVARQSLRRGFDEAEAVYVARSYAERSGVPAADVDVRVRSGEDGRPEVVVTITERRRTVFLALGALEEMAVTARGAASVVWAP